MNLTFCYNFETQEWEHIDVVAARYLKELDEKLKITYSRYDKLMAGDSSDMKPVEWIFLPLNHPDRKP